MLAFRLASFPTTESSPSIPASKCLVCRKSWGWEENNRPYPEHWWTLYLEQLRGNCVIFCWASPFSSRNMKLWKEWFMCEKTIRRRLPGKSLWSPECALQLWSPQLSSPLSPSHSSYCYWIIPRSILSGVRNSCVRQGTRNPSAQTGGFWELLSPVLITQRDYFPGRIKKVEGKGGGRSGVGGGSLVRKEKGAHWHKSYMSFS